MTRATEGAKWTGYFKFVTPQPNLTKMSDSQEMADASAYNNYSWYQRLVQGAASRLTRYREYDLMDNDVEVARALDTIAEEITGNKTRTQEPLDVVLLTADETRPDSTLVVTLRTAVRRWFRTMELDSKLFPTVRMSVKYGDCFFRRGKTAWNKWLFIHPKNVIAAIVDNKDITNIIGWQIKTEIEKPLSGNYGLPIGGKQEVQHATEVVSAKEIVRFTLADDMADTQPFGESILRAVFRSHKQKELLEDAILIYRIQRSPERRVFYIDVGKMNPARVKTYLEGIKNEIKQKKVPTLNGGKSEMDTVYNAHSMCLALDTKIPLLDGRTLTLQEMINEFEEGKKNWVYSINPKTGEVVPGPVSWAGVTRKNAETIKLILDNGDEVVCTPDHKIPVQGKGFVEAKDLTENDSLFPFNTRESLINPNDSWNQSKYRQVYNPATKTWKFVHRIVANYMREMDQHNEFVYDSKFKNDVKQTIHHANFSSLDNSPENLVWMNHNDHSRFHISLNANQEIVFAKDLFERFEKLANENIHIKFKDLLDKLSSDEIFMEIYKRDNGEPTKGKKYKIKIDALRQKMFLKFMKCFGYKNWRDYQNKQIQYRIAKAGCGNLQGVYNVELLQFVIEMISNVSIYNFAILKHLKTNKEVLKEFIGLYEKTFEDEQSKKVSLTTPTSRTLERVSNYYGYNSFKHLVEEFSNFNHRVVRIEKAAVQDTGTLTIDKEELHHNYHTFALTSCFVRNSEDFFFAQRPDGRGSKVETLPGGQGLGELADLEYFQRKVWRGLRIPTSYMMEQDTGGALFNDGKVGMAYIQELRFALFISRIQLQLEKTIDREFKKFLSSSGIRIDPEMYEIRLPEPSNFGKYRQLELDGQLLGSYASADGIPHFSKRFSMKKFMQMTDEEVITNEKLKAEELGLDPEDGVKNYPQIYAMPEGGDMGGAMGGDMGGLGAGFAGGGEEAGMGGMEGEEGAPGGAAEAAPGGAPGGAP